MRESTTYQAIVEEGRVEGRVEGRAEGRLEEGRRLLLRVGEDRFGAGPTPEQRAVIDVMTDADRLEDLVIRAGHVASWAELLEQPAPARATRRRRRRTSS
jgi:hypothetical protein